MAVKITASDTQFKPEVIDSYTTNGFETGDWNSDTWQLVNNPQMHKYVMGGSRVNGNISYTVAGNISGDGYQQYTIPFQLYYWYPTYFQAQPNELISFQEISFYKATSTSGTVRMQIIKAGKDGWISKDSSDLVASIDASVGTSQTLYSFAISDTSAQWPEGWYWVGFNKKANNSWRVNIANNFSGLMDNAEPENTISFDNTMNYYSNLSAFYARSELVYGSQYDNRDIIGRDNRYAAIWVRTSSTGNTSTQDEIQT